MKNRSFLKLIVIIAFVLLFAACDSGNDQQISDAEMFWQEFPSVGKDNIFVYRTTTETANILENGTGVVLLGFKECPWCQQYVEHLQDVAREMGIARIYYTDIRQDRENNTVSYQRILSVLVSSGRLQNDPQGNPRVYVPDITMVNKGVIVGRDYMDLDEIRGYTPQTFWTTERVNERKSKLREAMSRIEP
jgi:hypothetical protein